jgi:hypothetical protein
MRNARRALLWSSAAILVAAAGFGCSKPEGPGMLANEKLPPIDLDTALSVDEGRVAVVSPKGWHRAPRSKEYLVRYQRGVKKAYPAVTVTVEDPPTGITSVGKDGHAAFLEAMTSKLAERFTKDGKSTLTRGPKAVDLGDHFGVAWAAPGRTKNGGATESIDRLSYAVVFNGRLYTVEARGLRGKLDAEGILAAKAVARGLATPKPAAPAEPAEPAPESTPDEAPKPDAAEPAAEEAKPAAEEKPAIEPAA